jgi:hypothetical protein
MAKVSFFCFRIKGSVQKELRSLEERRAEMQRQVAAFVRKIDELKIDATRKTTDLEKLRISIEQARTARVELAERNTPEVRPPLRLTSTPKDNFLAGKFEHSNVCTFGTCFDLSRCPLTSGFPVYFYNNIYGWTSTKDGYGYLNPDPDKACLFVVSYNPAADLFNPEKDLSYWKGRILISVSNKYQFLAG